jgi:predicted N-acetyltransferase YhbS
VLLTPVSSDEYVRLVLPETHALWGGKRDLARYAADFRAVADSPYGRRRPFTIGLHDEEKLVTSCKLYERELRWASKTLRATGIGAVFTPPSYRGRGYASALLAMVLDRERAAGRDLAFLYSDIHPAFYQRLGFIPLPSRRLTLRAASLDDARSGAKPLEDRDRPGVQRCFRQLDVSRAWAFTRTPLVWKWIWQKWTAAPAPREQRVNLVVRHKRDVLVYVFALRVPREDMLFVEEFGFAGEDGRARLSAIFRAAAGDLARVRMWMPPPGARDALSRGSPSVRKNAIFMVAPISPAARDWWQANKIEILAARSDPAWVADHV